MEMPAQVVAQLQTGAVRLWSGWAARTWSIAPVAHIAEAADGLRQSFERASYNTPFHLQLEERCRQSKSVGKTQKLKLHTQIKKLIHVLGLIGVTSDLCHIR